ncbi:MAG: molybdopterin-dependent oxidoreductase [Proteobacteria bacterium]|nr:molybdopterin-dependent oxidoreductase [Pseudomonadota bacterium]
MMLNKGLRERKSGNTESSQKVLDEKIFSCMCVGNCQSRCRLFVHVRDGKAVKTSMAPFPDPRYNRVCLRGLSHVQRIYDPNRIKYPMKRVGARGEGKWERISWDEAIDTIVTKFKAYQEEFGPQSVAFSTVSGNMAMLNGMYSSFRLANLMHATQTDYSLDMADTFGLGRVIGSGGVFNQSNDPADLANAKTIIVWAANITDSHPHAWHSVVEAQKKGAKVVVVDPRFTTAAAKADQWISIRPGADPALAMSMAEVIISEKLYDPSYMLDHTVAPFLVRADTKRFLRHSDLTGVKPEKKTLDPYMVWDSDTNEAKPLDQVKTPSLEGTFTVSGITVTTAFSLLKGEMSQYTPESVAGICEVKAEDIRLLARLYATNTPSSIYPGFIQYNNGLQTGHAWGILASLTGNIAKQGASVGHCGLSGYNLNMLPFLFPRGKNTATIPWVYLKEVLKTGQFYGKPHPIKAMYFHGSNVVCNASNQNEIINTILPAIEFIVVVDMIETDTTRYADIILPASHWFERMEFVQGPDQPYTTLSEKAIEPAYESKSDMDIYRLISKGMGLGEFFDYTDEEFIKKLIDTDAARAAGLTWERLKEEKVIQTLPSCWVNWKGNKFPSPSGRLEFYLENPQPRVDCGIEIDQSREHLPIFTPPVEAWPDNPLWKKYPLVYHTVRHRWRLHSQWYSTPWLRELDQEPVARINPRDAKARGIKEGDIVEVYNDRGHVVIKAVLSEAQRPGIVTVPKGWQRDQFIAGSYQELTHDHVNTSDYNQSFYDVLCNVRKVQGR